MPPLYPLILSIQTPYGLVDLSQSLTFPDPKVLKALPARTVDRQNNLRGAGLVRVPQELSGWDLRLAIPDEYGLSLDFALPLQKCQPGDQLTITENLTRRDALRVWVNATVMDPDSGTWIVGNPRDGDYFSIAMNLFVAGA